jgi:calcium-dependent protein kinase
MQTDHPNLLKFFEILEDEDHYYIISELLQGGELYYKIIQLKSFSEQDCANIVKQILLGLNYMHSKNIIHRDIKPENILIKEGFQIKITDFGFARCFDPKGPGLTQHLGSPLYMAPEVVKKQAYGPKVDLWAVGIITYIMLLGKPPFKCESKKEVFD